MTNTLNFRMAQIAWGKVVSGNSESSNDEKKTQEFPGIYRAIKAECTDLRLICLSENRVWSEWHGAGSTQ